jgi:hypothetical protein
VKKTCMLTAATLNEELVCSCGERPCEEYRAWALDYLLEYPASAVLMQCPSCRELARIAMAPS